MRDYRNAPIALLTRHGKERLLAPVLEPALPCRLVHVDSVDTDSLGSFTRDIPRQGSQLEAARHKAELGATLAGCRFALASEGAFASDPWTGIAPWNVEVLMLLDTRSGFAVTGIAEGPALNRQGECQDLEALRAFAAGAGFPAHHLVIRPDHAAHPRIVKGIDTDERLAAAFADAMTASREGRVFAENDLRAHCNPTRQSVILEAARNLLARLDSLCPACGCPDFWLSGLIRGKPCASCDGPTSEVRSEQFACRLCAHAQTRARPGPAHADPAHCPFCNP